MALSTGWKIGIGTAVVGVGAWIIAVLSAKPAKAATTPENPSGGKILIPDDHNLIKLVPGDLGTLTMAGVIDPNGFYQTEGVVNVYVADALGGNITKFTSTNPDVYDASGVDLPSISLGLGYPLHQGTTLMTFTWTKDGVEYTTSFTVVAV